MMQDIDFNFSMFEKKYAKPIARGAVLDIVRNWSIYSHGVKFNIVKSPNLKRVLTFYLPTDEDKMVSTLSDLSLRGYSIANASTDQLTGVYFRRGRKNKTNIDADVVQVFIDHTNKLREVR